MYCNTTIILFMYISLSYISILRYYLIYVLTYIFNTLIFKLLKNTVDDNKLKKIFI